MLLLPLLIWQRQSPLAGTFFLLLVGGATGLLWSLAHHPTVFQAAVQVDQQLELGELLSTALLVRDGWGGPGQEAFIDAVMALAQAEAGRISAGSLVLHRLGARAWGSISLTVALALALAVFASWGAEMRAQVGWQPFISPGQLDDRHVFGLSSGTGGRSSASVQRRQEPSAAQGQAEEWLKDTGAQPRADYSASSPGAKQDGAGPGAAQTPGENVPSEALIARGTSARGQAGGELGWGAGISERAAGDWRADSGGTSVGVGAGDVVVPPWQSPQWSADRAGALVAVAAGKIPDSYRELIQGYFGPDR